MYLKRLHASNPLVTILSPPDFRCVSFRPPDSLWQLPVKVPQWLVVELDHATPRVQAQKLHPGRLTAGFHVQKWRFWRMIIFLSKWVMAVGSMLIYQGVKMKLETTIQLVFILQNLLGEGGMESCLKTVITHLTKIFICCDVISSLKRLGLATLRTPTLEYTKSSTLRSSQKKVRGFQGHWLVNSSHVNKGLLSLWLTRNSSLETAPCTSTLARIFGLSRAYRPCEGTWSNLDMSGLPQKKSIKRTLQQEGLTK